MIYTSSFKTYRHGIGRISIARYAPRGYPSGFRVYTALAPGSWFNSVPYPEYRRLYLAQLEKLDPERVVADLHRLGGSSPVLLCWEAPPLHDGNWCHRSLVAHWLETTLDLGVEEVHHGRHIDHGDLRPASTGQ